MKLDLARDPAMLGEELVGALRQEGEKQLVEAQKDPGPGLVQVEGCIVKVATCHLCANSRLNVDLLIGTD